MESCNKKCDISSVGRRPYNSSNWLGINLRIRNSWLTIVWKWESLIW